MSKVLSIEDLTNELLSKNETMGFISIPVNQYDDEYFLFVNSSIKKLCDISVLFLYKRINSEDDVKKLPPLNNLSFDYVVYSDPPDVLSYGHYKVDGKVMYDNTDFINSTINWGSKIAKKLGIEQRYAELFVKLVYNTSFDLLFNTFNLHKCINVLFNSGKITTLFNLSDDLIFKIIEVRQLNTPMLGLACGYSFILDKFKYFLNLSKNIDIKCILIGDAVVVQQENLEDVVYSMKTPQETVNYIDISASDPVYGGFLIPGKDAKFETTLVWLKNYQTDDPLDKGRFLWPNFKKTDVFNLFKNTFSRGALL